MQITVTVMNAFVDQGRGGNPAGVVFDADNLTVSQKLAIARQVKLSETAFVSASTSASIKIEFFSPTKQIPQCGHATIATIALCKQAGILENGFHYIELINVVMPVQIEGDMTFMYQRQPSFDVIDSESEIGGLALTSIGIGEKDLSPGMKMHVARSGNAFLLIPLRNESRLASLNPNQEIIEQISTALDLTGFYAYFNSAAELDRVVETRMFAPRYGIPEESATGTAAGPLAYFLNKVVGLNETSYMITQGRYMKPPSCSLIRAYLSTAPDGTPAIKVGGVALQIGDVRIEA